MKKFTLQVGSLKSEREIADQILQLIITEKEPTFQIEVIEEFQDTVIKTIAVDTDTIEGWSELERLMDIKERRSLENE